jgi:GxxExxY protein
MDHHRDTETQRSDFFLTEQVIGSCIEVHRHLGPGLLERFYEECVCDELVERRIEFERQQLIPIRYKGRTLSTNYRLDVVVEKRVPSF